MMRLPRLVTPLLVGLAILFLALAGRWMLTRHLYPIAPPMPADVGETMSTILARLDATLAERAPPVRQRLLPGLDAQQVAALEIQDGFWYSWKTISASSTGDYRCRLAPRRSGRLAGQR